MRLLQKTPFALLLLFLSACINSQSHPVVAPAPAAWEYQNVSICPQPASVQTTGTLIQNELRDRGAQGWELAAIQQLPGERGAGQCYLLVMKRPGVPAN